MKKSANPRDKRPTNKNNNIKNKMMYKKKKKTDDEGDDGKFEVVELNDKTKVFLSYYYISL